MLSSFAITLSRDGVFIDEGIATNVLGGPLSALRHFVQGLAEHLLGDGLRSGDLVTTGTITRAFPVQAGERWATIVTGLPVPGLRIAFA
jgi:2-keto-4-pentenoate hydratase